MACTEQRKSASIYRKWVNMGLFGDGCTYDALGNLYAAFDQLTMSLNAKKVLYDGTKVAACMAAMKAACSIDTKEPPECKAVFTGTIADGASCSDNRACVSGVCSGTATGCGKCMKLADLGEACTSDEVCSCSAYCVGGKCVVATPPTASQPCSFSLNCAAGLYCPTTQPTPTCAALAKLGEACDGSTLCDDTSTCGPQDNCVAKSQKTEACVSSGDCATGLVCVADPTTQKATCLTPAKTGEACTVAGQCAYADQTCVSGKCASLPAKGQPCPNYQCDKHLICDTSDLTKPAVCVALLASGATCASDLSATPCDDGLVCIGGKCTASLSCD